MSVVKRKRFVCLLLQCMFIFEAIGDDFQSTLGHLRPQEDDDVQARAVLDLIKRIIPERAGEFAIIVTNGIAPTGKDAFRLLKLANGTIEITGTTGVAAATGFNYYLKNYCSSHISWEVSQLNLSDVLPNVNLTVISRDRFRYYQNVCTTSYSFVWWNWPQWERHIDWMALNSFNLILASAGQEAIWTMVYAKLGMTQAEIDEHFAGPAFLSWSRMGNIRGWGGPLSNSWHQRSLALQKLILNRMRSFGMIPVLPAFAGHVPRAFKRLFPNANMQVIGTWNNFNDTYCCPYLLDPTEHLYKIVGNMFLQQLISAFGTDHVYNCDTFNEMEPFTKNLTYLSQIGRSTYAAMTDVDGDAIWIMQGWLFVHELFYWTTDRAKALLTSVPKVSLDFIKWSVLRLLQGWTFYSEADYWKEQEVVTFLRSVPLGKMIVLDLQSEQFPQYDRFQSYFGQPYIWCMLHNFGGTLGMYGSADIINQKPISSREESGSTMIGTGITAEGINQNYIIYDLMTEASWKDKPSNLTEWFSNYVRRRYGRAEVNAEAAWQILATTVYNFNGLERLRGKYTVNRSPSLNLSPWYWYNMCDMYDAWNHFVEASDSLGGQAGYRHDLVDFTRQVLQHIADEIYNALVYSFRNRYLQSFQNSARQFLSLFDDLDDILATNEAFLLGKWLNSAKNASLNEEDEELFEYNARNQITLWGPKGEIKDYASKQWSGVVANYFKPRWSLFLSKMNESLVQKKNFNESAAKQLIFKQVEEPFTFARNEFPEEAVGDTVEVARRIYTKWWPSIHCRITRRIHRTYYAYSPEGLRGSEEADFVALI